MSATPSSRPQSVTTAVILLVLVLLAGVASTLYQSAHNAAMQSMSQHPGVQGVMYVVWAVVFVVELFFIYKIFQGRNWARITMLVLFLLGAVFSIPALLGMGSIPVPAFARILGLVSLAVNLVAFILLFTGQGSTWFKKRVD